MIDGFLVLRIVLSTLMVGMSMCVKADAVDAWVALHSKTEVVSAQRPTERIETFFVSLVIEVPSDNPSIPVMAMVSSDVLDASGKVVVGRGSWVFGQYIKQVNDRHQIFWTEIVLVGAGDRLIFSPPANAISIDGSSGVVEFKRAGRAGLVIYKVGELLRSQL